MNNLLDSYYGDLRDRLEKHPVTKCENCTYAKPYPDHSLESFKARTKVLSDRIDEIYRQNDEEMNKSWRDRGVLQFPTFERYELNDLNDRIDMIENCVLCQRFPESVRKRKDDKCGEYRKKK